MFDTLTYANKLKEAGFTEKQAETIATVQAELIDKQLVTREYLDLRLSEVRRDLKELEMRLDSRLKELELRLEARIAESKAEIVKWCVGSIFASVGLFAALVKLMG